MPTKWIGLWRLPFAFHSFQLKTALFNLDDINVQDSRLFSASLVSKTSPFFQCCGLCFWHKPTELAHSFFYSVLVSICLYGPFNCITFHKFSWQLLVFSICSCGLSSALLVLSTIYLFVKVSLNGLQRRIQTMEMRCYRKILHISYK